MNTWIILHGGNADNGSEKNDRFFAEFEAAWSDPNKEMKELDAIRLASK